MNTLLTIRMMYYKKHPIESIWSYFCPGLLVFFLAFWMIGENLLSYFPYQQIYSNQIEKQNHICLILD